MTKIMEAAAMLAVVLALLAPTMSAQGQDVNHRLTGVAARAVIVPDGNLPPISAAALSVAPGLNNDGTRRIMLVLGNPTGQYIARGFNNGDSDPVILGVWQFDGGPTQPTNLTVMNGNPNTVLPSIGQFWKVDAVHILGGTVERLQAIAGPYNDPLSGGPTFTVGGETLINNGATYVISIGGKLGPETTVAIGGWAIGDFRPTPFGGGTASFSSFAIGYGLTTITVCGKVPPVDGLPSSNGSWCGTDIYRPKVQPPDGKGE